MYSNGRLTDWLIDIITSAWTENCVLPSRVISLCLTDTAIKQAYYYTANILAAWGDRQAAARYGHPFGWADDWMGGCMWPGLRVLRYYLTSTSRGNGDLGERCLHGTGIRSQQYRSLLWQEITIYNPQWSGCQIAIHDTRSQNRNITTCYATSLTSSITSSDHYTNL